MLGDLSIGSVVRAGASILLAVMGAVVLAVGWRSRRNLWLGISLVAVGGAFTAVNLTPGPAAVADAGSWIGIALLAPGVVAAGLLLRDTARGLPPDSRRPLWLAAATAAAAAAVSLWLAWREPAALLQGFAAREGSPKLFALRLTFGTAVQSLWVVTGVAMVERLRAGRGSRRHALATAFLVVPLVHLPVFGLGASSVRFVLHGFDGPQAFVVWDVALGLMGCLWWVRVLGGRHRGVAPGVMILLLSFTAAGSFSALLDTKDADDIAAGLVRTGAILSLSFAVFRLDALRVPLRLVTMRTGALASAGLAALLITAQILQNFLSDELGLLWGGVVAGAVVVASVPLQRAAERRAQAADHDQVFRRAAKLALRDRVLKPPEERDLLVLAGRLGLRNERAFEILDDERARGRRRRA